MNDQPEITSKCPLCGGPTHLVQDSTGSEWYHKSAYAEHMCRDAHRAEYGYKLTEVKP